MALPPNGNFSNPTGEGTYTDYSSTGHPVRTLWMPALGFRDVEFLAEFTNTVYHVSALTKAALDAALLDAADGGGGVVQIPAGTIVLNGRVDIPDNVIVQGAGQGITTLDAGNHTGAVLEAKYRHNIVVRDLTLAGNGVANQMVLVWYSKNFLFERCTITNADGKGLRFRYSSQWTVRYCTSSGHRDFHGIGTKDFFPDVDKAGTLADAEFQAGNLGDYGSLWTNNFAIYSNYFRDNGGHGIDIHSENGEICGNFTSGNFYGNKCPDCIDIWWHNNYCRDGQHGTRSTRTHGVAGREPIGQWYIDNVFENNAVAIAFQDGCEAFISNNVYRNVITYASIRPEDDITTAPGSFESGFDDVTEDATKAATAESLRGTEPRPGGDLPPPAPAGAPYAASEVITAISWESAANVLVLAEGSDNWPITWSDDNLLYTAWGDGFGFDPFWPSKLSMGFATVDGDPPTITGVNIASNNTTTGAGAAGKKASGILSVGGVLYLWVRNANGSGEQCQLWSSSDSGVNWSQHFTWAEFGLCTFVNFGQDYAGAKDQYIYTVTPDGPSAYTGYDDMVLMRVPKAQVTTKSAYEFYAGLNANGNPVWTGTIGSRLAAFTWAGRCYRCSVSYNAGLGRYILRNTRYVAGQDFKVTGGFALFEAPDPWGPWKTVFYTESWDEPPGESGAFPTKWMSADGKTLYMVYSADDAFNVRKATLTATTVDPAQAQGIAERRIALGENDAEETLSGEVKVASVDLDIGDAGNGDWIGMRFLSLQVPFAANIISAHIEFTALTESAVTPANMTFYAEDTGSSVVFAPELHNVSERSRTSTIVSWFNVPAWTDGGIYLTPNLGPIVQDIVNRNDWTQGNALGIIIRGDVQRKAYSADGSPTYAPKLVVEYEVAPVIHLKRGVLGWSGYAALLVVDDEDRMVLSQGGLAVTGYAVTVTSHIVIVCSAGELTLDPYTIALDVQVLTDPLSFPGPVAGGALVEAVP